MTRFLTLAFAAGFLATPATAQSSRSFLDCSSITDSLERLICYDEAVGKLRSEAIISGDTATLSSAPRIVGGGTGAGSSALAAPSVTVPIQSPEDYESANSGTYGVAEAKRFGNTIMVLLDNGAVWRQIDGKDFRLPSGGVQTATVVPAFENSYFLSISKDGAERVRQMRVRRVR